MSIKPPLRPESKTRSQLPKPVVALGYGGLIPFVTLATSLWFADANVKMHAGVALVGYGATIACFIGAIHWGLAMRETHQNRPIFYIWGIIPSLFAWSALLLKPAIGLLTLAALLWVCYGVDRVAYAHYELRNWLPMRLRLTIAASSSCLAGAAGLLQ